MAQTRAERLNQFHEWLIKERGISPKPAADIVSRCKRIEGILDEKLEVAVHSQHALNKALRRIWTTLPRRNDLMYAMRLYAQFRDPSLDTHRWAFYGETRTLELNA